MGHLEVLKNKLFDADAMNVSNVKLYPGGDREAAGEEMAEQLLKAIAQIEAGDAEDITF